MDSPKPTKELCKPCSVATNSLKKAATRKRVSTAPAKTGEEDVMATHALAFLARGMCSDFKHVIAYYFTENVTPYQLMSIFWKVVGVLELSLKLPVCATVNDGTSSNRKFFDLKNAFR